MQQYVNGTDDAMQRQHLDATVSLMFAIENATQQTQTKAVTQDGGETARKTLREELYADDFRARDRTQSAISASDTATDKP